MNDMTTDLDRLLDGTEQLGVIGSPSSTAELALDILGAAVTRKLVGELALFRFQQDGDPHYALGQITEIELRNIWHEDPTMRSLIRQRGRVDAVSGRQDTHLGKMLTSAVFRRNARQGYEPSIVGTVPSTGTAINLVNDEVLNVLLKPYRDQIFYLGHVYGSQPKLPLWFKHFDTGPDGAGEAYHLGIFGKTGSGKSVLAKMMLLAYARYKKMALLVIDPQGEFAKDIRKGSGSGGFGLPVGDVIRALGKHVVPLTIRNLVLDRWELFEEILFESPFFDRLTIRYATNKEPACSVLRERLEKNRDATLSRLHLRDTFNIVWQLLGDDKIQQKFIASRETRARFADALADANQDDFYNDYWKPVAELFREDRKGAKSIEAALAWLLNDDSGNRPALVIDLSKEHTEGLFWNDKIQSLVIKRLLDGLAFTAERFYEGDKNLNTLVVIDEAHRLAPREPSSDDDSAKAVRNTLIDAVRTTRKYGLGWLFISQTLSSLHPEIIQQLRIFFFGFGLGLGQEFQALRQLVGSSGTALDLYQSFRDPHSAIDPSSRQYSFMTIGPVSPLSFSGSPLFLNAFNQKAAFLDANKLRAS